MLGPACRVGLLTLCGSQKRPLGVGHSRRGHAAFDRHSEGKQTPGVCYRKVPKAPEKGLPPPFKRHPKHLLMILLNKNMSPKILRKGALILPVDPWWMPWVSTLVKDILFNFLVFNACAVMGKETWWKVTAHSSKCRENHHGNGIPHALGPAACR